MKGGVRGEENCCHRRAVSVNIQKARQPQPRGRAHQALSPQTLKKDPPGTPICGLCTLDLLSGHEAEWSGPEEKRASISWPPLDASSWLPFLLFTQSLSPRQVLVPP